MIIAILYYFNKFFIFLFILAIQLLRTYWLTHFSPILIT